MTFNPDNRNEHDTQTILNNDYLKELINMKKKIKDLEKYKEGFFILMEYWDSMPDEEKIHIHEKIEVLGL